jgi:hypothetical protein
MMSTLIYKDIFEMNFDVFEIETNSIYVTIRPNFISFTSSRSSLRKKSHIEEKRNEVKCNGEYSLQCKGMK